MLLLFIFQLFFDFVMTAAIATSGDNRVEQVHLSLSGNMNEMIVTWLTQSPLPNVTPFVSYGLSADNLKWTSKATTTKWADEGEKSVHRYTHRATMKNMSPGQRYYYSVGSSQAKSNIFWFTQPDPSQPLRMAIFGDLSLNKGFSIDPLINATHSGDLDIIIHIGDLAYDLQDDNGNVGDDYMNAIEPMAAYIPYMVFPGNHEVSHNFNHMVNRFTMPKNGVYDNNLFWSLDFGMIHFVSLNTEYYAEGMSKETKAQYEWFVDDLKENKAKWLIVLLHRPLYCSTKSAKGCHDPQDIITREGNADFPGLEQVFIDNKVDVVFYGHKHTYERMWPMKHGIPIKSEDSSYIKNPEAPVYILTGAAGCHSHSGPDDSIAQPFSIARLGNYGYTKFHLHNSTHISTHFIDTSDNIGKPLDRFYIEKQ
ncbi:unnamed protein product [Caenorhabditis angaria]|uniref:Purple acid phosphatase n=1 Tax=Caenorhabditis angaria TaxID=860376 RepID=A0A9P1INN3_9PELO|nr:unnamed protein product [Caenorhabditis angaria]